VTITIDRNFLEIKSIDDLKEGKKPNYNYTIKKVEPAIFSLISFFTKILEKNTDGQTVLFGQRMIG
jgi:hypothetical protein